MLRRLAISLAATSALVLTATAPALADHGGPMPIDVITQDDVKGGNVRDCGHLAEIDPEMYEAALKTHEQWNFNGNNTATPPAEVHHSWWDVSFEAEEDRQNALLNIEDVSDGKILLVIVKGANATNVFVNEPGEDMLGLYAPPLDGGKHPTISHYSICKIDTLPEEPDEEPPADDEEKQEDEEPPAKDEDGKGGGETTPTPEPSKTPVPVPTAVPAGLSGDADGGSMAPVGIAAAALALLAGGAALVRRQFHHG